MNKFFHSLLSLSLVASIFVVSSCDDDKGDVVTPVVTPAAPSFTITGAANPSSATVIPGEAVSFNLAISAPAGFSALHVLKSGGTPADHVVVSRGASVEKSYQYPFTYTPADEEAGETIVYTFKAIDEEKQESTHTYTITVNHPPITEFETLIIGDRFNRTVGSLYNLHDNVIYMHAEATENKSMVDFVHYYNGTNNFTMAAPSNGTARVVYGANLPLDGMDNRTMFVRTNASYAAITTPAHIEAAWNNRPEGVVPATHVTKLLVGDVFAFKLDDSRDARLGVAEVVSTENVTTQTRKITLRVKTTTGAN